MKSLLPIFLLYCLPLLSQVAIADKPEDNNQEVQTILSMLKDLCYHKGERIDTIDMEGRRAITLFLKEIGLPVPHLSGDEFFDTLTAQWENHKTLYRDEDFLKISLIKPGIKYTLSKVNAESKLSSFYITDTSYLSINPPEFKTVIDTILYLSDRTGRCPGDYRPGFKPFITKEAHSRLLAIPYKQICPTNPSCNKHILFSKEVVPATYNSYTDIRPFTEKDKGFVPDTLFMTRELLVTDISLTLHRAQDIIPFIERQSPANNDCSIAIMIDSEGKQKQVIQLVSGYWSQLYSDSCFQDLPPCDIPSKTH